MVLSRRLFIESLSSSAYRVRAGYWMKFHKLFEHKETEQLFIWTVRFYVSRVKFENIKNSIEL